MATKLTIRSTIEEALRAAAETLDAEIESLEDALMHSRALDNRPPPSFSEKGTRPASKSINTTQFENRLAEFRTRREAILALAPDRGPVLVCPDCGSEQIEETAWLNVNTGRVSSSGPDGPRDIFFCTNCEQEQKRLEERTAPKETA